MVRHRTTTIDGCPNKSGFNSQSICPNHAVNAIVIVLHEHDDLNRQLRFRMEPTQKKMIIHLTPQTIKTQPQRLLRLVAFAVSVRLRRPFEDEAPMLPVAQLHVVDGVQLAPINHRPDHDNRATTSIMPTIRPNSVWPTNWDPRVHRT